MDHVIKNDRNVEDSHNTGSVFQVVCFWIDLTFFFPAVPDDVPKEIPHGSVTRGTSGKTPLEVVYTDPFGTGSIKVSTKDINEKAGKKAFF